MNALDYTIDIEQIVVREPTDQHVIDAINALNNDDRSYVGVSHRGNEKIVIIGGNQERVRLIRVGSGVLEVELWDANLHDDPRTIYLETSYGGSDLPIYTTVTKEIAIKACLEYLNNHVLSKDLTWWESAKKRIVPQDELG